jgi:hypothetical protein
VTWLGLSDYPGRDLGQDWTNVFTGLIASDLSISGTWGDVDYPNPRLVDAYAPAQGQILLHIQFDETGRPVLVLPESTGNYLGHVWVPRSTMPAIVEIEGLLGGAEFGCPWVESAGTRYALLQGDRVGDAQGNWTLFENEGAFTLQDRSGRVGAEKGDAIRVSGQPFPLAYCAPDAGEGWEALLVETVTPIR